MEDAAIYEPNLDNANSLFAVFDGHGGSTLTIKAIKSANTSLIGSPSC